MKKTTVLKAGTLALFVAAAASGITSCTADDIINVLATALGMDSTNIDQHTGYDWEEEDTEHLEDDINILNIVDDDYEGQGYVDLTNYLPPIGDQGQYGTCVAWASAYNARTFLFARENGYTKSQLADKSKHFSPKYIFYALSNRSSCDGSYFEEVLDLIQKEGVATMQSMPYESMGNCSGDPSSSQRSNAANYKIKSYREIDITKPSNIKAYLDQGRVIVFGAQLGDEFMLADRDFSYLYEQTSFNYSGMHANHAMVIAGYDDNKGPHGCFLVVNSWGESWGNKGYIWVDQEYMCGGKFAFCGFVLNGFNEAPAISTTTNEVVNPISGIDVIPTDLSYDDYEVDESETDPDEIENAEDPLWRTCYYDVFNAGSSSIPASSDWAICLLYYDAYNANNYDVLLADYYSDDNGDPGEVEPLWDPSDARRTLGLKAQAYSWNHVNVGGGKSVATAVFGDDAEDGFAWSFKMPSDLNGDYYIVLVADAFNSLEESNKDNNYLYLTNTKGGPLHFVNGVSNDATVSLKAKAKMMRPKQNDPSPCQTMVNENNLNTYTPAEISAMINAEKESGRLKTKALKWAKSAEGQAVMAKAKRGYKAK
ncbi:MAG: C1 family peptidase [Bacteroidales bacterium]|nr:C1 family peptidase [Bacteroidales bacterium]